MEHLLFTEKYRPKKINDCILPERLKKPFQEYVNQSNIPNLLLAGGPGVGKTTVAKAMCEEVGCDYMVINGSSSPLSGLIDSDSNTDITCAGLIAIEFEALPLKAFSNNFTAMISPLN